VDDGLMQVGDSLTVRTASGPVNVANRTIGWSTLRSYFQVLRGAQPLNNYPIKWTGLALGVVVKSKVGWCGAAVEYWSIAILDEGEAHER
jgi:hypothetical protein